MDLWVLLAFIFLIFVMMSCCGFCCSTKKRGTVLSTPVVVTSATHTAPGGYQHQQTMYPPYPTQTQHVPVQMPMPMPSAQPPMPGVQPYMAPYPPASAANMNPPSYDTVVAGTAVGAQNNSSSGYEKQAPYNPSYNAY